MGERPTWTDCDEAGDYVVPYVLSPRDLVFRPDNMDETVPHTHIHTHIHTHTHAHKIMGLTHILAAILAVDYQILYQIDANSFTECLTHKRLNLNIHEY